MRRPLWDWVRLVLAATISIAVLAATAEGADQRSASAAAGGRVCHGTLVLVADEQHLTLAHASHWATDSWTHAPPHEIRNRGPGVVGRWTSEGGTLRGCHNTVRYHAGHATLEFSLTMHWSGDVSPHCLPQCYAQIAFKSGNELDVVWVVRLP